MATFLVRQEIDPTRVAEDHLAFVAAIIKSSVAPSDDLERLGFGSQVRWIRSYAIFGQKNSFFMVYEAPSREAVVAALGNLPGLVSIDRAREIHHANVLVELEAVGVTL